ncbi:MAG: toll/interleukin-1 receptor domain-containing protein [Clostridia bacterium]|nr:toll/interleukin-1 receptor domain-containing protein [Clostridia bacterium]
MIAYEGKEPYAFVSYSHRDIDLVLPIIARLKQNMCRVWYDEGLTPGESWNDSIAEHLKNCSQFILFISPDSIASKYVMSEINYALTKDKDIVPVILRKTELPAGLEMMLGTIQFLDISDYNGDIGKSVGMISSVLSKSVFSLTSMPFLEDLGYSFYMTTQNVERQEINEKSAATIFCRDSEGKETEIFNLSRLGAYEVSYRISSVEAMKDYFFPGKIIGSYQINIMGTFLLEYPLYGPDVDVLLILILRIPRHGEPTLKLVDYQYVDSVSSLNCLEQENLDVVGEIGWSAQIKKYLEGKLYN